MKNMIYSSLLAVLLLGLYPNNANAQDDKTVYNFVSMENPPTYPGGMAKFYDFLGANIKYPSVAKEKKIEGNVHVSFTVETDGAVADIKVERRVSPEIDEEAVRVLKASKKWNPGMLNGKPVRVKYNIPIKFSLKQKVTEAVTDTTVFNFVSMETPPTYPGGIKELYKFLGDNIKYPKEAKDKNVAATVFVSFVVEKDGAVSNIIALDRLKYGFGEEAKRVFKLSKKWNPGMHNGKPVRVKYNLPVKFALGDTKH
jgi:TonB family protein